jgi:hypothetical protein
MRKLFPGYYSPSKDEFDIIWEKGIFIFDTNVLLDLYRFSEATVEALVSLMESIKDRIWLPFQVTKEYHSNLNTVISDQIRKYESTIKSLTEFKKQMDEKRNHPFLSDALTVEIESFCTKFDKELVRKKDIVKQLILKNPIKEKIADLIENNVGKRLTQEEVQKIIVEGEQRYKDRVPPGFGDIKKVSPGKYGDLILWKEILRKNSEIDIPILFVTGDNKDDWYFKEFGMTIGPRPELVDEFKAVKDNLFYMYPTDKFLEYSKDYLTLKIDEEAIKEIGNYILENSNRPVDGDIESESFLDHHNNNDEILDGNSDESDGPNDNTGNIEPDIQMDGDESVNEIIQ